MARYSTKVESQTAQLSGAPVTTTFNGYFMAVVAGAATGFKLRRLKIGVRAGASVPTSQQMSIAMFRQTVRVAGTGFSTVVGQAFDPNANTSQISGVDITTAATAGTTGPTLNAVSMDEWTFNTQAGLDLPWEMLEELMNALGTANGIALENVGNALPAAHLFTVGVEWEE
jgi:hypothetical protein